MADVEGYVHSIETAGTVDGPGLRLVVFVTGCPLRCAYCHNPDTWKLKNGKKTTARAMVEDAAQYKDFLLRTGGGVTVTGGEPLCQQEFVTEIFRGVKEIGLPTALDTSGYTGVDVSEDLLAATDLVLLDIKSFDAETYERVTRKKLQPTLDLAEKLAVMKKPMCVCVCVCACARVSERDAGR